MPSVIFLVEGARNEQATECLVTVYNNQLIIRCAMCYAVDAGIMVYSNLLKYRIRMHNYIQSFLDLRCFYSLIRLFLFKLSYSLP